MHDIDLDKIVNYEAEYMTAIKKAKKSGSNVIGLCPFHDDSNNSFSADIKTGKWYCFAEGRGGNFVDFEAERTGTDTKEAWKSICERYHVALDPKEEKPKKKLPEPYSLSEYAEAKKLPEQFLAMSFHLETKRDRDGVSYLYIPYYTADGDQIVHRKRYGKKDFRWSYKSSGKICLYAEWNVPEYEKNGQAVLVEGESDTQSMIYMGFPALGVPGASMFKSKQAALLENLNIYLHIEPDHGGEVFLAKMVDQLREADFAGHVYRWTCGSLGVKDPSEAFMKYGKEQAAELIKGLLADAERVDIYDLASTIPEVISDAPIQLRQPDKWVYGNSGISYIKDNQTPPELVCRTPVILTKRMKNLETQEEKIQIAFKRDDRWQVDAFPRSTVFTTRGITALSDLGCTITSENAKKVVQFLGALEATNIDVIKKVDSTNTMGWKSKGRFLPGHARDIELDVDVSQRQLAAAYSTMGTMEAWTERMRPHRGRNKFRFILAASFTAPLLRIIRQRIFFVYNWGGSKGGKTAALKAALSAWGDPERLMVNFNATQVALERMAGFYCDLPLGIDERQLAGNNQDSLEKIVYMLASGTGKARGAKGGGLQATQVWRTVALATGEEPISNSRTQTGVSTRVLEIIGGPFESEREASDMHQTVGYDYGWAGPLFVGHLLTMNEERIRDDFDEWVSFVGIHANGKSGSHIAAIAAVALADQYLSEWIFNEEDSVHRARDMAVAILEEQMSTDDGDVNEHATQYVLDWILSSTNNFGTSATGLCYGFIKDNVAYIYPSILNNALERGGYSVRKTMRYLAENHIIRAQEGGDKMRYSHPYRFDGRLSRFVAFDIGAAEGDRPKGGGQESEFEEVKDAELPF